MTIDTSPTNWKDIAELIGIAAIVFSLIFVGLQMKQEQEIARATLYQMRSDSAREIGMMAVENHEVRASMARIAGADRQDLSSEDLILINRVCEVILGHYENSHYPYQQGFTSQEQWDSDLQQLAETLPLFCQAVWAEQFRTGFRTSFAEVVDAILRTPE